MISQTEPPPPAPPSSSPSPTPSSWTSWAVLALFTFMAFECVLLAFAMKGSWLILIAPGVVCGVKAWDTWRTLKRAAE